MTSNSIGKIFSFTTWGESHGKAIGCVVDGVPSNINLTEKKQTLNFSADRILKSNLLYKIKLLRNEVNF